MKNIITLIYNNLNTILASPQNQLMVLIVLIQAVSIGYFLLGKKKNLIILCFISIIWTVGIVLIVGRLPLVYIPKIFRLGGYTFLAFGAILSYNRWYRPLKSNFWYWIISTIVIYAAMDISQDCLFFHMLTGQHSHSVVYYAIEVLEVEVEPSMRNIHLFWVYVCFLVICPTYFIVMFIGELGLDNSKRIKKFFRFIKDKFTTCFFYVIYICGPVTRRKKLKEIKNYMIDSFNLCSFYVFLIIKLIKQIIKNLKK